MLRLSNIHIGTKLAVMSGIGVVLVAAMAFVVWRGNSSVREANVAAMSQIEIARDIENIKSKGRAMQLGVRDLRLAISKAEEQKALDTVAATQKEIDAAIDPLISRLRLPENRERAQKLKGLFAEYASAIKEFAPLKDQVFDLETRRTDGNAADTAARIAGLNEQLAKLARERTLPIVAAAEDLIGQIETVADKTAEQEAANAEDTMSSAQRLGLGIGALVLAVLIGSAFFGVFSIAKPIRKIVDILGAIEKGNTKIEIAATERGDEIGALAKAAVVIRAARDADMANSRIRTALDVVRSNVMLSDDGYNIIYMNQTLQQMLRDAEAELRKVLPSFDAGKLIGANMDVFHKNPAHQRRMLDGLTGSHETHIAVGTQKFHLIATAVLDKDNKRAGTVVEWRNETAEKAIEAEINGVVNAAVAGDFTKRVPTEGKKDFMLNLATAMNGLCENVANALNDLVRMLSALAEGDLTPRITAEYQGAFATLKTDANAMADRLSSTIADIKAAAREVTNASAEISTSTTDLSQRTEEQAASLEETSASMEQIASTVKKNAENAQAANESAGSTRNVGDRGGQVVAQAVEAMAKIEESSRKISDIIGVIDEIARQTNLLALNAAVEAARAGEAGRGFAVVASEVRSLAQRSSQAAKDIKDLITNSNNQVKDGVDLVNKAGTALTEIVESIKKVAGIVSDIAAASIEQSTGIEQVNKALTQMDEVTQQNSALVEENAATAKTLEEQSKAMDQRVAFFRIDDSAKADSTMQPAAAQAQKAAAAAAKPQAVARPKPQLAAKAQPVPKRAAATGGGPVARMQAAIATAMKNDPDWKEF